MSLLKRIVILNNEKDNIKKGILSFVKSQSEVSCNLKTQNLDQTKSHLVSIMIDDKKLSDLFVEPFKISDFHFSINHTSNIQGKISVLITCESDLSPQMFGTTCAESEFGINSLLKAVEEKKKEKTEIESYANKKEEKTEKKLEKNSTDPAFFEVVKKQVEEMFLTYPKFETLESLVENSNWIKVDLNGSQNFYALGIIFEGENPRYIGYAIPSLKEVPPPKHLENYCQYLANDEKTGFYLMFQDAQNGNSVVLWSASAFHFFLKINCKYC